VEALRRRAVGAAFAVAAAASLAACAPAPPLPPADVRELGDQVDGAARVRASTLAEALAGEAYALTLLGDTPAAAVAAVADSAPSSSGVYALGDDIVVPVGDGSCAVASTSSRTATIRPC
jgi:hypothetical protein